MFRNLARLQPRIVSQAHANLRVPDRLRFQAPFFAKPSKPQLELAIGDISGTYMDWFSYSPITALLALFKKYRIHLTPEEACVPMGKHKKVHLRELFNLPCVGQETLCVREKWRKAYGKSEPTVYNDQLDETQDINNLVEEMFFDLKQIQVDVLKEHVAQIGEFIPGALEAHHEMLDLGLQVTATTGFIREMADVLLVPAAKKGLTFSAVVAGDEVSYGSRPHPHMIHKVMSMMNLYERHKIVKFGDTREDIGEGLNAGVWTVGLARYSNYVNLPSRAAYEAMLKQEPEALKRRIQFAREQLMAAGAHYVVDSIADMPKVICDINSRLEAGERPDNRPNAASCEELLLEDKDDAKASYRA